MQLAVYQAYEDQCQREGVVDFAELLLRCYELLQRNEPLRKHYQERFRYILVDEVQDTLTRYGITRTDQQVEDALDSAAVEWSGRNLSRYATAGELYYRTEWWDMLLHEPHGVYDYLEIDCEDDNNLYDREKGN